MLPVTGTAEMAVVAVPEAPSESKELILAPKQGRDPRHNESRM